MFDLKKYFLDFLFPIECLGCSQANTWLCPSCIKNLLSNKFSSFNILVKGVDVEVAYLADYQDLWEKIIVNFKYNFISELIDIIDRAVTEIIREDDLHKFFPKGWVLVPVPLSKKRQAWRGFNQAEIIAKLVAKRTGLTVENDLIFRQRNTRPQVGLSRKQRRKNLNDAFRVKPRSDIKGVILVDDVVTTGSTLLECSQALQISGVKMVKAFVLARG